MILFLVLTIFTINNIVEVTCQNNLAILIKSGEPIPIECKTNKPSGPQCSDDCSSLMICQNDQLISKPISCNKISSSRPYCVNNACTILRNQTNPNCDGQFRCSIPGLYPDPNNCNRFYECKNDEQIYANIYQCSDGRIFDTKLNTCVIGNVRLCPINWCPLRRSDAVAYSSNSEFYMFCIDNEFGWRQKIIMKCPINFIFDTRQQRCIYNCKQNGKFVDNLNCTKFHFCERYGLRFNWFHETCPNGFYFNKIRCVIHDEESCITNSMTSTLSTESTTELLPTTFTFPTPSSVSPSTTTDQTPPVTSSSSTTEEIPTVTSSSLSTEETTPPEASSSLSTEEISSVTSSSTENTSSVPQTTETTDEELPSSSSSSSSNNLPPGLNDDDKIINLNIETTKSPNDIFNDHLEFVTWHYP